MPPDSFVKFIRAITEQDNESLSEVLETLFKSQWNVKDVLTASSTCQQSKGALKYYNCGKEGHLSVGLY